MRIVTVNVNGIRAAARKGMGQWLEQSAPQVLLLQEVRADSEIAAGLLPGYEAHVLPCRIKGRAGVAVAVREGLALVLWSPTSIRGVGWRRIWFCPLASS